MRLSLRRLYFSLILFITLSPIVAQFTIPTILIDAFPNKECIAYCTGNFTPKGGQEYLAFYHNIESRIINSISMVIIIGVQNGKINYKYDCNLQTLPYSKKEKDIINNPRLEFGTWRAYCYVNDYNGNGLDEILLFEKTGMSFEPVICEFKNNKIKKVLLSPSSDWNSVSKMETGIDAEGKYIRLWTSRETIKSKMPWYIYRWDTEKQLYLIKEKGFD